MSRTPHRALRAGFTLIEMILAIAITVGLMLVLLYFYQQAGRLRRDALLEVERVTAARLLMERMTRELRSARHDPFLLLGLKGASNSIEFVCATLAMPTDWGSEEALFPAPPPSDLKIVRYSLMVDEQATNATGIARAEERLLDIAPSASAPTPTATPPIEPAPTTEGPVTTESSVPAEPGVPVAMVVPQRQVLADTLRYLNLRYWDGTQWLDGWGQLSLPAGVEITLAAQAPVEETDEVFRRVVYLPGSKQILDLPVPVDVTELLWEAE